MNYYIADVFAKEVFNGAQIAVFPNADHLSTDYMQVIAQELNLSETVFVSRLENEPYKRRMRIFSPLEEKDFAGHPIIATAFVLGVCGDITLSKTITPFIFQQNIGEIEVNITSEKGRPTFVQFNHQSSASIDCFAPTDEELANFLGLEQAELDHKKYSARLVSCGFPYLIVPVWRYASVRHAKFNYAAWSQSSAPQTVAAEILLFAPKSPFNDADFNLRLLGPNIGIHDDPPVGTAIPAFANYLCCFACTQKGTHVFAVDRGDAKIRRSVLNIEMDNKDKALLNLRIGGTAVMFATGQINV